MLKRILPRLASLVLSATTLVATAFLALVLSAHLNQTEQASFEETLASVAVIPPPGTPPINQESIDLAIAMYGIVIPSHVVGPRLVRSLEERGLAERTTWSPEATVSIGPNAFESWGVLASTIIHEVHGHAMQNILAIHVLNLVGMNGTAIAERQAYTLELSHASRLGLNESETHFIRETRDFYYPAEGGLATASATSWRDWIRSRMSALANRAVQ